MDSSDDRELIFWAGMLGRGDEVSLSLDEFISKKMDSSDDRELIFGAGMCGAGRGDEVSLSLDEFISENGLVR